MMGRKKTVRKNVLNSSHRRVSRMATNRDRGSLRAVSTVANTSEFLKASQKIGSAAIFWELTSPTKSVSGRVPTQLNTASQAVGSTSTADKAPKCATAG